MPKILSIQAIAVSPTSPNRSTGAAPGGTTRFYVTSPVDCYMQISAGDQSPFRGEMTVQFMRNPNAGEVWQCGAGLGGVWTWVDTLPGPNQIKRGADLTASMSALMATMAAIGMDCASTGTGAFRMLVPDLGQSSDEGWSYQGQMYLSLTSGTFYATQGAGMFIKAGQPTPVLPAVPGQNVWLLGVPGGASSNPATDNGAAVAWMDG